jgi:hypothetical protein
MSMSNLLQATAFGIALLAPFPAAAGDGPSTGIFVVVENGAVVTDPDTSIETLRHLFGELVALRRKRTSRDTDIAIVLTARPTEIA